MTKNKDQDKGYTTERVLKAAIKAQHDQAERIKAGGAHDVVANLSSRDQRTVMEVINER
jgi:hypothetical protein